MTTAKDRPPLAGVKVIDLTTFLSGPFCTQILADLGADVVKVESPEGDSSRSIPPHFMGDDSAYFLANNRNKRSLAVDLKTPEGLDLVRRLIGEADVVVENFRPGVLDRLGLGAEGLRKAHPSLIWASISGFGPTSPWAKRPAYDMIVQALSGVMSLTGEPGGASVRLGIPAGDTVAGLYTVIAINAAMIERANTGKGRHVDVAMLDCQLAMLSYQGAYSLIAGVTPGHQGARHDSIPTYRAFIARDGREVVVTANTDRMWRGLCSALDLSDLVEEPLFADADARLKNRAALWARLEPAFLARDGADWAQILTENDVPNALINTVPEALASARRSGREMIISMANANGEEIEVVGNPIRIDGAVPTAPRYPPALGADASEVLKGWLRLSEEKIASYFDSGILTARKAAQ